MENNSAVLELDEQSVKEELIYLSNNVSKGYLILKRALDIICSLTGIILLSPIFIIVAILIKLEDPKGSVFFGQERCGQFTKPFKM
ncbi:MAG: sugar transferase, partial [Paraclostridium dentum]